MLDIIVSRFEWPLVRIAQYNCSPFTIYLFSYEPPLHHLSLVRRLSVLLKVHTSFTRSFTSAMFSLDHGPVDC